MWRWALACGGTGLLLVGAVVALRPREPIPDRRPRVRVEAVDLSVSVPVGGTIEAAPPVGIDAPSGGRLTRWLVAVGDQVVQGQPLAILEIPGVRQTAPSPMGLEPLAVGPIVGEVTDPALAQAQARVERLRAELASAPVTSAAGTEARRAGLRKAQEERRRAVETTQPAEQAEATAALATAQSDLADAQAEYDRQLELERQGVVTARSVQSAKLAIGVAGDRLASAQAASDGLRAKFAAETARLDATIRRRLIEFDRVRGDDPARVTKREELRSAEAEVARVRRSSPRPGSSIAVTPPVPSSSPSTWRTPSVTSEVRATASGTVVRRAIEAGTPVRKGETVATLQNRARWTVRLRTSANDTARLRPGLPIRVSLTMGTEPLDGQVVRLSGTEVVATLLSAQSSLRPGSKVRGTIQTAFQKGAISLPKGVVHRDGETYYVDRPEGRGSRRTVVRIGLSDAERIEILSGLRIGDEVLSPTSAGNRGTSQR